MMPFENSFFGFVTISFSWGQETSLDDFSSALKERWEARIQLEQLEKEAAKATKQKEMEIKKEVCLMFSVARARVCLSSCVCLFRASFFSAEMFSPIHSRSSGAIGLPNFVVERKASVGFS